MLFLLSKNNNTYVLINTKRKTYTITTQKSTLKCHTCQSSQCPHTNFLLTELLNLPLKPKYQSHQLTPKSIPHHLKLTPSPSPKPQSLIPAQSAYHPYQNPTNLAIIVTQLFIKTATPII